MFRFVDLFAGCGGLSLGFENAGGTSVLAVEKSDMAAHTYYRNFFNAGITSNEWATYLNQSIGAQASRGLVVAELRRVLDSSETNLPALDVDVVAGGPPCQGFSLAGRRNPGDARNMLPWEFLEFVERVSPKAVVIENVVGMSRSFSGDLPSVFEQLQTALEQTEPEYVVQGLAVNAKHFGAAQHRPRLMILGLRKDIAQSRGIVSSRTVWRSAYLDEIETLPDLAPSPTIPSARERTVRQALEDLQNAESPAPVRSELLEDLRRMVVPAVRKAPAPGQVRNHVERRHTVQVIERFRLYQWLASETLSHRTISALNYGSIADRESARQSLRRATYPAVAPDGAVLAGNAHEMEEVIVRLATRKHSQKALVWDEPSKTVVTLPDDYVHPSEPRILTVRELARLQGFPDSFEFMGRETTGAHRRRFEVPQYSQVGNAVSPFLGMAMGKLLDSLIGVPALDYAAPQAS